MLKVHEKTIRRYIDAGKLPVVKLTKKTYRIDKADLIAFIEERKKENKK